MKSAYDAASDFASRREREQRRHYARRPKKIGDVLAQLITARGYGRIQADGEMIAAWQMAAGRQLARFTRPGRLRRGVLEVTVSNSTTVQELSFEKERILAVLQEQLPDANQRPPLPHRLSHIDYTSYRNNIVTTEDTESTENSIDQSLRRNPTADSCTH